jgi:predicted acyl esterase
VFLPGHRVRVHVTSSLFPLWERNLNTGTRTAAPEAIKVARQTVYHSREYSSYVLLPVME